jgi:hypothetical protein
MKKGGGESWVRNPPSTQVVVPSPSVSSVRSSPGRYSSAAASRPAAGENPRAFRSEFRGPANQHDILARDSGGGLEHHRVAQPVRHGGAVPDLRRGDVLGARLGQPAAHERLVLGPQRRPPVLAGQAEIAGRERGLGLQVVGVGDDCLRGGQPGDGPDQLPRVPDIAAHVPDRRHGRDPHIPVVIRPGARAARPGQQSRGKPERQPPLTVTANQLRRAAIQPTPSRYPSPLMVVIS